MKKLLAFGALMPLALAATPASAATTIFTDRTAFEAALGAFTVVDFTGLSGSFDGATFDAGPFSLTGDSTGGFTDMTVGGGQVNANTCGVPVCGFDFGYTIDFDAPIIGFGADYSSVNSGSGIEFDIGGGIFDGPTASNGFFGFISDTAFSSITVSGGNEVHQFDDVTFGAVPEPATWAFMIFGFGAIGGALRRNRKANVKVSYA